MMPTHQTENDLILTAENYIENGLYNEALSVLKNGIRKFPANANFQIQIAYCHILLNDLTTAASHLDAAKFIDSKSLSLGWMEARLLLRQRKFKEALQIARELNCKFPNDNEGQGVLGSCLRVNGFPTESLNLLNIAISNNPKYA